MSGAVRHRSARRSPKAEGLYVWIVGSLVLGTSALSLYDTYLLLSLLSE